MKITLAQQSLHLLRTIMQTPGWAKTTKDLYVGGRMLAQTLPEPNLDWLLPPAKLQALTQEERSDYRAKDRAWANTEVEIDISDRERDTIRKAIEKLTESGEFGTNPYLFQLLDTFGFKPE